MSTKKGKIRPAYYIYFMDEKIKVDPIVFAKFSRKFAREYKNQPEGLEIKERVSKTACYTFLKMCQEKSYEIDYDDSQDITYLTRKWECPLLEDTIVAFCYRNKLIVRPWPDPIGNLIECIDRESISREDLYDVAKVLNKSFNDDRIGDIDPEILFRVVLIAQKEFDFSMARFKKFVMGLFKTNPSTAVILTLRLNISNFSEDEIATLKSCPDLRSQSINFFFAQALSTERNKINEKTDDVLVDLLELLKEEEKKEDTMKQTFLTELQNYENEKKDMIQKRLDQQKEKIEKLYPKLLDLAANFDAGPLSATGLVEKNTLAAIYKAQEDVEEFIKSVHDRLNDGKMEMRGRIRKSIETKRNQWEIEKTDPEILFRDLHSKLNTVSSMNDDIVRERDEIDTELEDLKATINAKIVRDKLRFDKGRRDEKKKFEIFNDEDRAALAKADKVLDDLELNIETNCPFRKH